VHVTNKSAAKEAHDSGTAAHSKQIHVVNVSLAAFAILLSTSTFANSSRVAVRHAPHC
jgi:hypothetical protein